MLTNVKKIRRELKPLMNIKFWVREWNDGIIWAGTVNQSQKNMENLKSKLEQLGYKCECKGKRGTSGEFIIDIVGSECST